MLASLHSHHVRLQQDSDGHQKKKSNLVPHLRQQEDTGRAVVACHLAGLLSRSDADGEEL